MATISPNCKEALTHLKNLKPYDGWTIEIHSSTKEVRLLRRSIALTDNYFRDIHYDVVSGNVVGILLRGPPTKAQILVDDRGKPLGKTPAIIVITTWSPPGSNKASSSRQYSSGAAAPPRGEPALSEQQNQMLMKYAGYAVMIAIAAKALMGAFTTLAFLALPFLYLYATSTLPPVESFEAKKELKRVMRGHHLPEDHPDKPKVRFLWSVCVLDFNECRLTAKIIGLVIGDVNASSSFCHDGVSHRFGIFNNDEHFCGRRNHSASGCPYCQSSILLDRGFQQMALSVLDGN